MKETLCVQHHHKLDRGTSLLALSLTHESVILLVLQRNATAVTDATIHVYTTACSLSLRGRASLRNLNGS